MHQAIQVGSRFCSARLAYYCKRLPIVFLHIFTDVPNNPTIKLATSSGRACYIDPSATAPRNRRKPSQLISPGQASLACSFAVSRGCPHRSGRLRTFAKTTRLYLKTPLLFPQISQFPVPGPMDLRHASDQTPPPHSPSLAARGRLLALPHRAQTAAVSGRTKAD
jgi:hypothetical protein